MCNELVVKRFIICQSKYDFYINKRNTKSFCLVFNIRYNRMELQKFFDVLKVLDTINPTKMPQFVNQIKQTLASYQDDFSKLGPALFKLSETIMRIRDVRDEYVDYYEQLINEVIRIVLKNQFKVGAAVFNFIFNPSMEFYKSASIDTHLNYPLGKNRTLKQYSPSVGQICDVVRPYISTLSVCGWSRCIVKQIENNKYTIQYMSSEPQTIKRDKPWFAPLGTRMKDYDWRVNLQVGSPIQALLNKVWYEATVSEVGQENGYKKVRVTFRRFAENGNRVDSFGNRFFGLNAGQDEWMDVCSPRIQRCGKMVNKKLCYIRQTAGELLQDQYDTLFQQQFKQKTFFAIARPFVTKSASILTFVSTFIENDGLEKALALFDDQQCHDDILFLILTVVCMIVSFIPRMLLEFCPLKDIYKKIALLFATQAKNLNNVKIQQAFFCFDMIGRRVYSLSEVYRDENQVRKVLIREFLKMNMEKQMLAVRYLVQLVNPKNPYTEDQKQSFHDFLKQQNIFSQIFNMNIHEQILSRTVFLLQYMIKNEIISVKQFESLWTIVPVTDTRGRATIEKLLTDISKNIPINFVSLLLQKILQLKQTELTIDNLNLLRQLKNRQLSTDMQMKILSFLWDVLTIKSGNIKTNIEQQVQKVFKLYVSIIKDARIRTNVLESMIQKIQDCKKLKNQIQLLKDFIKSYSETKQVNTGNADQMVEEGTENIPHTVSEAVLFVKAKGIYFSILGLLFKTKDDNGKKDILQFFTFLFDYDSEDVNSIIKEIYRNMGPSTLFLQWLNKISHRARQFIQQFFQNTVDFSHFQNLNEKGFEAIHGLIYSINQSQKKIKIITTYIYKNQNKKQVGTSTSTPGPIVGPIGPVTGDAGTTPTQKKDEKFIGPLLPNQTRESKKHIYVLVSPFHLIGMKFLQNLLFIVKQTPVYNSTIKLIIQLITNLDESIEDKVIEYRKQFLIDVIQQIRKIIQENNYDDKIKTKLEVHINLLMEIFAESQRDGLGDLQPHFQKVEGDIYTLNVENLFEKDKIKNSKQPHPKIKVVCNQNITLWGLKKIIAGMIQQIPQNVDIIKYIDPIPDTSNGKSITQLLFYDKQNIKIQKKPAKTILRLNLLNESKTDVTQKFGQYITKLFNGYKNYEIGGLGREDVIRLSKQKWRGTLFKQRSRLDKLFEEFDKGQKGYLSYQDFKNVLLSKTIKNENTVWTLIKFSGYNPNLTPISSSPSPPPPINSESMPRKILSCEQVYNLIFSILQNPKFKQIHLNFYKLLCILEVNNNVSEQIQNKIYKIIQNQQSMYTLCYSIQVINSELAKRSSFFVKFWQSGGLDIIHDRVLRLLGAEQSVYELETIMKEQILPGMLKICNMYVAEVLQQYKIVRFVNKNRINYLEVEDLAEKIKGFNCPRVDNNRCTEISKKLWETGQVVERLRAIYKTCKLVFNNMLVKLEPKKSDYLSKLTSEIGKIMASLIGSNESYHNYTPYQFLPHVTNLSMGNRRLITNFIYIYFYYSDNQTTQQNLQQFLRKMLDSMPLTSNIQNFNYFQLLNKMCAKHIQRNPDKTRSDQFYIQVGNTILNNYFDKYQPQSRTAIISDKTTVVIFTIIDTLSKKMSLRHALSWRMLEITEKCLFAYNMEDKLNQLQITEEMKNKQTQALHFKNYTMCKTEDTRNLVYKCVADFHSVAPTIQPHFINNYIMPIVYSINPQVRLTSTRNTEVGLKNFGSTCYMNSMLQVLNSVVPFRNLLMRCQSEAPLIKQLKNLFAALFFTQRMDYAPANLLTAFVPPINPGLQQDTTQFLNFLFDQLQSALSPTKYKRLLDQIFKGANTVQMICHSCGYKKENREQFFSFGVEIEGKYDLHAALQGSYQGQIISDYLCDQCQNRGQTTKRNVLSQIPSVLFIHLRRIVFNYDMFVNMKIHTRLAFPEQLNIEPYTKQGIQLRQQFGLEYMKNLSHNEEQMKKFEQLAQHNKPKDFYKLKLKGVIVHSGSADVGHYYSILQNDKNWRRYDDSRVTFFGASSFESDCFGGNFVADQWGSGSSANAYVLVYEKVVKNPIRLTVQGAQIAQQGAILQYDNIKVYNSDQYYKSLWLDNHNFMLQRHLLQQKFSKPYIDFISNILQTTDSSSINKVTVISQVVYRISYHSGVVGNLIKYVQENQTQIQQKHLYDYILADKSKTFKLLFSQEKSVREFMAQYMAIVCVELYRREDQKVRADVVTYIVELLNSMCGEVAKNWLRIDGYFSLLYKLVCASKEFPNLWELFTLKDFIANLIDYVMQKQSPVRINPKNYSLGTKANPMDFSSGISIISFYLRHSYGFTGNNYESPKIPQPYISHLSDNAVICLSHLQFYRKMLRQKQNLKELSTIIQRLCIMNLQFSKAICQVLLQSICLITDSQDEMFDYAHICLEILKIRDDYWVNRAQFLLGLGVPFFMNNNIMATLDQERYVYTSTIYDIFPVQCLFSYVYLYRLKNTLACFQLVKSILQGCSVSDVAMTYLLRQPSPSYYYSSFFNWIENFVESFIDFATSDDKVKERLKGEVTYIIKYIQDFRNFIKEHPQIDYYKSLITGQVKNKTQIQSFEKDGVQVKIYEYDVYCLKSQVLQKGGNLAMQPYLDGMRLVRPTSDKSNILKFLKKPAKAIALTMDPSNDQQDKQILELFNPQPQKQKQTLTQETSHPEPKPEPQPQPQSHSQPHPQPQPQHPSTSPITEPPSHQQPQQPDQFLPQIEQQQINLSNVQICKYFRQIEFINKTKDKKILKLTFSTASYPNMIIPKQFTFKLYTKNSQCMWLAKQDCEKQWGHLQMKSFVQDFVAERHEKKKVSFWWFKMYGDSHEKQSVQVEKMEESKPVQQNNKQVGPQPGPKVSEHDVDYSEINCPVCTFFNPISNKECEACGSPLQ